MCMPDTESVNWWIVTPSFSHCWAIMIVWFLLLVDYVINYFANCWSFIYYHEGIAPKWLTKMPAASLCRPPGRRLSTARLVYVSLIHAYGQKSTSQFINLAPKDQLTQDRFSVVNRCMPADIQEQLIYLNDERQTIDSMLLDCLFNDFFNNKNRSTTQTKTLARPTQNLSTKN